jgi:hypothetical protein
MISHSSQRTHTFTGIRTQNERDDAEFGGWNGAMFESGMHRAGALVAPARCAARMLQPLWRAAAQCAAAAATALPHARATHEELPADGALNFCAAAAPVCSAPAEFHVAE